MKKYFKKIILFAASAVTALSLAVSASAQTVEDENLNPSMNFESEDIEENARIANYFTVGLTNKEYKYVGTDNNLLDEDAYFTCSALSGNIQSIDIRVYVKHENKNYDFNDVKVGDTVGPVRVRFLYGYEVKVRVHTGNVSSSNPGTVTIYWTDAD